ncbi:MAG: zinc ribbon domain-containing protein [Butyricicoccaceae bacterium]
MEQKQYECPKCGCRQYTADQMQATGGNFAKIFDIQNKKFTMISCNRCGYTEFYRKANSDGWDILDFLMGG